MTIAGASEHGLQQTPTAPTISLCRAYGGESCRDLQVLQCAQMKDKSERLHHQFDFFALIAITGGRGDFCCDDGPTQVVTAGDIFYLHPGSVFSYGPVNGEVWQEFHCCVDGERLAAWRQRGWLPPDNRVWRLAQANALDEIFRRVAALQRSNQYGDQDRAIIAAEQLFCEAYHHRRNQQQQHDHLVTAWLDWCQRDLARAATMAAPAMAAEVGVSYSSLRQRVRRATGLSPARLLLQLRCQQAQELLHDPQITVAEVAHRCGFEDPYSFSRSFKRVIGTSPQHWRQHIITWQGG